MSKESTERLRDIELKQERLRFEADLRARQRETARKEAAFQALKSLGYGIGSLMNGNYLASK